MRQLTTFRDAAATQRFTAWLITQKIDAHSEHEQGKDGDQWAIWVRDEDRLAAARHELKLFEAEPHHERYQGAERQAVALRDDEVRRREQAKRNLMDASKAWGNGATTRKTPLVTAVILITIVVGVLTSVGDTKDPRLIASLQFCDGLLALRKPGDAPLEERLTPVWKNIQQGQVWRLVTPVFLHFGLAHIIFNMMWLYDFGGQVETQIKWFRSLVLLLIVAILSNITEVVVSSLWDAPYFPFAGNFGGMSGVNYGLFGFIYIRSAVQGDRRYILRPGTALLMFVWLFGCIVWNFIPRHIVGPDAPFIANGAHFAGVIVGMALAFVPGVFDPPRKAA